MIEDKLLYENFLNHNKEAFEELIVKYKNNLIYFISRYTKNIEAAEDIFQDVILFILENPNYYNSDYSFKAYLYMIAKSKALNYIKFEKITENIDDKEEELKEENILEEIVLSRERKKNIKKVINKMPLEYQLVIYLTKIEELSYKETGLIMNKREAEIKKLSYKARKKLKELLLEKEIIEIKNNKIIKLLIFLVIVSVISSGAVIAKNTINKLFFGGSEGFNSAIENNYSITDSDASYIYSNNIGIKIENIILDNSYLGIDFNMKYDNEEYNMLNMFFENIIIYDEDNCILYCNKKEMFNDFCKSKELDYIWEESNDFINSGISIYNSNPNDCIYNLYAKEFPKSKEIFVDIQNIINQTDNRIVINGKWNLNIKLTEEMYNRKTRKFANLNIVDNLEIINVEASKTNTKVEFSLKGNIPWDEMLEKEKFVAKLYNEGKTPQEISEITSSMQFKSESPINAFKNVYLENENGEKFYQDFDLPESNKLTMNENEDYIEAMFTMSLTEFDCTDLLYFYFNLGDEQYKIELVNK